MKEEEEEAGEDENDKDDMVFKESTYVQTLRQEKTKTAD